MFIIVTYYTVVFVCVVHCRKVSLILWLIIIIIKNKDVDDTNYITQIDVYG